MFCHHFTHSCRSFNKKTIHRGKTNWIRNRHIQAKLLLAVIAISHETPPTHSCDFIFFSLFCFAFVVFFNAFSQWIRNIGTGLDKKNETNVLDEEMGSIFYFLACCMCAYFLCFLFLLYIWVNYNFLVQLVWKLKVDLNNFWPVHFITHPGRWLRITVFLAVTSPYATVYEEIRHKNGPCCAVILVTVIQHRIQHRICAVYRLMHAVFPL